MGFPIGFSDLECEEIKNLTPAWGKNWEDDLKRTTANLKNREQRLKVLGNAIVPQCAQAIARAIKKFEVSSDDK